MTNEEAIKGLKNVSTMFTGYKPNEEMFAMAIKALEQQPCEMTVEEYRQRMIDAFHNADCDNLIALVALPSEKEFEHLEWLLKNHYHNQKQQPCEDAVSRADALKALDCDIKHYEFKKGVSKYMDDIVKLLDIIYVTQSNAIKALPPVTPKQQPCEDAISRRATVERLCKVADFMNEKRSGSGSPYIMAALFIQDNKNEFPSVTPKEKTEWIPVSKGLPNECSGVLVYCPENDNIFLAYLEHGKWYIFSPHCDEPLDEPIIAWMPLPEPYKAESENTDGNS